jgi:hypothetical protein
MALARNRLKKATTQSESFKEAARALECDESEARFNEALGKIVRHKPKPADPPATNDKPTDEKKPAK